MTNSLSVKHILHHEKEEYKFSNKHLANAKQIKLILAKNRSKAISDAYEECIKRYCDWNYPPSTIQVYPGTVIEKLDGTTWIMNCDAQHSLIYLPGLMHKDASKKTYIEVVAPAHCLFQLMHLESNKKEGRGIAIPEVFEAAARIYDDQTAMEINSYFHYMELG